LSGALTLAFLGECLLAVSERGMAYHDIVAKTMVYRAAPLPNFFAEVKRTLAGPRFGGTARHYATGQVTAPTPTATAHEVATRSTPTPAAAGSAHGTDQLAVLEQLAKLRDSGVLTEDEFAAKKAEILARI
jgi:hypothetical protein